MRRPTLAIVAALALLLVACSEQPPEVSINDQVPADQRIEEAEPGAEGDEGAGDASLDDADAVWVAEGLAYTSSPASIPSGGALVALEVVGGLPHDVWLEGFNGDTLLVDGPGEGVFFGEWDIPPGDYTYYCSIPGHRAAGMEGTVTVE